MSVYQRVPLVFIRFRLGFLHEINHPAGLLKVHERGSMDFLNRGSHHQAPEIFITNSHTYPMIAGFYDVFMMFMCSHVFTFCAAPWWRTTPSHYQPWLCNWIHKITRVWVQHSDSKKTRAGLVDHPILIHLWMPNFDTTPQPSGWYDRCPCRCEAESLRIKSTRRISPMDIPWFLQDKYVVDVLDSVYIHIYIYI